jgi:hypothetical protein
MTRTSIDPRRIDQAMRPAMMMCCRMLRRDAAKA